MPFIKPTAKQQFRLEILESRELLSATPMTDAHHVAMPTPSPVSAEVARSVGVQIATTGYWINLKSSPDTGRQYEISTSGRFFGLGRVAISGQFSTPGFIASGVVTGTATARTNRGTLSLNLTSAPVPGFYNLPPTFNFTFAGGTGIFSRYHTGQGTVQVTFLYNPPTPAPDPLMLPQHVRMVFSGRLS